MERLRGQASLWVLIVAALVVVIGVPVYAQDDGGVVEPENPGAVAILQDAEGNLIGRVAFFERENGVLVEAYVGPLPPGFHGFHLHTTGQCDPDADPPFSSAGEHWSLDDADHPNHTGDLTALYVKEDGTAAYEVETDRFTLEDLFDDDGTAAMIHELPDNFANIPDRYLEAPDEAPDEETLSAGDSGARLACGVVERPEDVAEMEMAATAEVGATEAATEPMTGDMTEAPGEAAPTEPAADVAATAEAGATGAATEAATVAPDEAATEAAANGVANSDQAVQEATGLVEGSVAGDEPQAVDVTLTEYEIDMPSSLVAGSFIFNVSNAGQEEHNLRFALLSNLDEEVPSELTFDEEEPSRTGEDRADWVFDENLGPGESGTLELELGPGVYEVFCPVDDHAEQGMRLQITVHSPEG